MEGGREEGKSLKKEKEKLSRRKKESTKTAKTLTRKRTKTTRIPEPQSGVSWDSLAPPSGSSVGAGSR
jgi:hypothetical protein